MTFRRLNREMDGIEMLEWMAYLKIMDEAAKDADPDNMTDVERRAYLIGAASAQRVE